MYRIGTVARLAQVSVRTLRHYDDVGLLSPARVDPETGYRWYGPEQLARLHRILALRDLGVPLGEIAELLGHDVTVEQLRGILLLRRAEAHDRIAAEAERLARVEARLQQLEEHDMDGYEVIVKALDPVRVVAASEDITGPDEIGDALGRLYPRLHAALGRRGVEFREPSYALYEDTDDERLSLRVAAALPVPDGVTIADDGVDTVELPAVARAATTVVRGAPEAFFHDAFRALHDWAERTGEQTTGFEREVYLDCDGSRDTWVTELQAILAPKP
jgi:DNA-binding transcriptional MerR regulator